MRIFFCALAISAVSACAVTPVNKYSSTRLAADGADNKVNEEKLGDRMAAAERALREARLTDAEIAYRDLAESHPRLPDVWLHLGNIYARQAKLEAAIRAYDEGLNYRPEDGRLWNNLAVVQLKQAIVTLEESVRVLPASDPHRERALRFHEALLTAGSKNKPRAEQTSYRSSDRNRTGLAP